MPLNIPVNLPAVELLKNENIFVMDDLRASSQDIRPLRIVILNLMPLKITTETDLIRLLSNTPLQVEIDFLKTACHTSKNTPVEHMQMFYKEFDRVRNETYDGMIITGAPVELMDFEEVDYWDEVTEIFDWARTHVTSTLYICWAAQAGLYHFYGVPKYKLEKKMFGVFKHKVNDVQNPIFRGFDDEFYVPHSRHTEVRAEDIRRIRELSIVSESEESGVYMVMARGGREFLLQVIPNILLIHWTGSTDGTYRKVSISIYRKIIIEIIIRKRDLLCVGEDMRICYSRTGSTISYINRHLTISGR